MFAAATSNAGASGRAGRRILIIRIGSMGDVLHALPAVATLKHSFPGSTLSWVLHPRWMPLVEGNPFIDTVIPFDRRAAAGVRAAWRMLRRSRYDLAIDFQGLVQSAVIASLARPDRIFGFHTSQVRERLAALFYSTKVRAASAHVVDRNLELVAAAGASTILRTFPLPAGVEEGELPAEDFVLACPVAGWAGKQWPLDRYAVLAQRLRAELGIALVLNGPPETAPLLGRIRDAVPHFSGLAGLIAATRRATAVLGTDSGPMHLAAALARPGVAIFGPTDPARNGPYSDTFRVLRSPRAATTYKRRSEPDPSMLEISPDEVFEALQAVISPHRRSAGSPA